jgi:hypothetical protein
VQRVQHRQEALPRHGEDPVAALCDELIDQDTAAGACGAHRVILPFVSSEVEKRRAPAGFSLTLADYAKLWTNPTRARRGL